MPIIEWREELATGDSVIDAQHRSLVKMASDLHDALFNEKPAEYVEPLIHGFERYLSHHFEAERQLMESSGFPATRQHQLKHDELLLSAREMIQKWHKSSGSMSAMVILSLVRALVEHIVGEDRKMVQWSRINGGLSAPSGHFAMKDSFPLRAARQLEPSVPTSRSMPAARRVEIPERDSQKLTAQLPRDLTARDSIKTPAASSSLSPLRSSPTVATRRPTNGTARDSIKTPAARSSLSPARDSIKTPAARSSLSPVRDSIKTPAASSSLLPVRDSQTVSTQRPTNGSMHDSQKISTERPANWAARDSQRATPTTPEASSELNTQAWVGRRRNSWGPLDLLRIAVAGKRHK